MHLISINIGKPTSLGARKQLTGIFKQPADGPIQLDPLGIEGDAVLDKKHHGGLDQAIYIYFQPDYDWWVEQLSTPLTPGTFGENLTISGLQSADIAIGDRLHMGNVTLEITAPRVPCNVLAQRMDDKYFVKAFNKANRSGAYARVITPGPVSAGDPVTHTPFTGERVYITEMLTNHISPDAATTARYLKTPVAARMRQRWVD